METPQLGLESDISSSVPSSISKPKRVRTYLPRRPRIFPTATRRKLEQLGHRPPSSDTTRANLTYLIDRLSSDLNNYRTSADYWQGKYTELKISMGQESTSIGSVNSNGARIENSATSSGPIGETIILSPRNSISNDSSELLGLIFDPIGDIDLFLDLQSGNISNSDAASSIGAHVFGRLNSTSNPSLSIVNLDLPKLRSNVRHLIKDSTFSMVIRGMETLIGNRVDLSDFDKQCALSRWLKPDFSREKALEMWNIIFAPMDVHPSRLMFLASSSCRMGGLEYTEDDPDLDFFDRVLAKAADEEIVDMLQYCSLMVSGMHQAVFDDPTLADARPHLGRACERILREVLFSRNTTLNSNIAQSLLDGAIGSLGHFSTQNMTSAVVSIVELSWHIITLHPNTVHPTVKLLISFFGMLLAKTPSTRAVWKQRSDVIRNDPANGTCFQVICLGYFAEAYYAMLMRDEPLALRAVNTLDAIFDEMPSDVDSLETWDTIAYHSVFSPPFSSHLQKTNSSSRTNISTNNQLQDVLTDTYRSLLDDDDFVASDSWFTPNSFHPADADRPQPTKSSVYSRFIDEYGEPYVMGENLKSIMRFSLQVIRAEAAIVFGDEEACRKWVDEAEKTMLSIPVDYMFQRTSMSVTKNIIKETCTFPTGTRTVLEEFERDRKSVV